MSSRPASRLAVSVVVVASYLAAVMSPALADCAKDTDCKGDGICDNRVCVSPPPAGSAPRAGPIIAPPPEVAPIAPAPTPPLAAPPAPPAEGLRVKADNDARERAVRERLADEARKKREADEAEARAVAEQRAAGEQKQQADLDAARGPTRLLGYSLLGGAAVSLIATAGFGLSANSKRASLDDTCIDRRCPRSAVDDYDSMKNQAALSTVFLVSTIVLSAAGIFFLIRASKLQPPAATAVSFGPGGVLF